MSKTLSLTQLAEERTQTFVERAHSNYTGRTLIGIIRDIRGLGSLLLITLGVVAIKFNTAGAVIHPLVRRHITRAGLRLLPMTAFLAFALGMAVIGQTVLILNRYGVENYVGTVMVTVVMRELGPIMAALLVLARIGTANVIELGTARAMGEVEALEALGIDPIHYLVVPRVIGIAFSIFALTIYFIMFALMSGYLFAFVEGVPLLPGDYFRQLANALIWQDFMLLVLKTISFGSFIAVMTCYEGLAQPLHLEDVSRATTSAVAKCIMGVVLLDAVFIIVYLVV